MAQAALYIVSIIAIVQLLEWWPGCATFPLETQTMDWYQRSAYSLLGFHFLERSGVKHFFPSSY
ncbi:conserved hypothetical protein [Ricinus communis]|uniref:Uncharacterized protein n=1 Tax=Ricinus communis TaxID=3988 RepID=B9SZ23_RICCO|nr:conserved hypothetical protein [Ricinus communis]